MLLCHRFGRTWRFSSTTCSSTSSPPSTLTPPSRLSSTSNCTTRCRSCAMWPGTVMSYAVKLENIPLLSSSESWLSWGLELAQRQSGVTYEYCWRLQNKYCLCLQVLRHAVSGEETPAERIFVIPEDIKMLHWTDIRYSREGHCFPLRFIGLSKTWRQKSCMKYEYIIICILNFYARLLTLSIHNEDLFAWKRFVAGFSKYYVILRSYWPNMYIHVVTFCSEWWLTKKWPCEVVIGECTYTYVECA